MGNTTSIRTNQISFRRYSLVKTTSGAWWSESCKGKPRNRWRRTFQASSQNMSQWQFPWACPLSVLVNTITQWERWCKEFNKYSLQVSRIGDECMNHRFTQNSNWLTNSLEMYRVLLTITVPEVFMPWSRMATRVNTSIIGPYNSPAIFYWFE